MVKYSWCIVFLRGRSIDVASTVRVVRIIRRQEVQLILGIRTCSSESSTVRAGFGHHVPSARRGHFMLRSAEQEVALQSMAAALYSLVPYLVLAPSIHSQLERPMGSFTWCMMPIDVYLFLYGLSTVFQGSTNHKYIERCIEVQYSDPWVTAV